MNTPKHRWLITVGTLAIAVIASTTTFARGGRGAGGHFGGGAGSRGRSRASYSGGGSIRYSAPGRSHSRPTTPAYSRPSRPPYAQQGTPRVSPRTTGRPSVGGGVARPSAQTYQPGNNGSLINHGTITTPGGSTIGWVNPPGRGGAVGTKGPDGGTAGALRGPGGGGAAGVKGPDGAAAGAIRGPGGGGAAGIRGPGGGAAGAVWGPAGHGIAGVGGPYSGRYVTTLPSGAFHYSWGNHDYWCLGFSWYTPCWVGDSVYYAWAYPPVGYYYPSLPPQYNTTVVNHTTYYESDGVYYQEGEKDGKKGYIVAGAPECTENSQPQEENPFTILKTMCDYVAGLEALSVVANTTTDEIGASGEKVQICARRVINVSRPNKIAADTVGDRGERRVVYDGKTISMLDHTHCAYSVIKVPDTIDATLDVLAANYGAALPLADLLYSNLYDRLEALTSTGQYVGLHEVNGLKCHHLAFLSQTLSWELWVEAGDKPAPRKITIDYGQNANRSRYSADILAWTESPAFTPATFEFKLPLIAREIEVAPIAGAGTKTHPKAGQP